MAKTGEGDQSATTGRSQQWWNQRLAKEGLGVIRGKQVIKRGRRPKR